jgi:regulation of enolase protein 1 (concanavalin A-like superfamily)
MRSADQVHAASPDTAPPLPAPSGTVLNVSTESQLQNAVNTAPPGATIVIAPGTYTLSSTLYLDVDDLTLRGATNNRNDVVLVGRGMTNGNYGPVRFGIWTNRQRITIANLTIRDIYDHHIFMNAGTEAPRVYNVRMVDAGSQFIKANPETTGGGVDNGRVEYSVFEYTTNAPDYYTSGVDVHSGSGWTIRNSLFRNFRTTNGQMADPVILVWNGSRDTIVEGNAIINSQRGIVLGLEDRTPDDHTGGIIRNNFIYRSASVTGDAAIYVGDSPNTQILHNTILMSGTQSSPIQYRFPDTTGVVIRNNLLDGSILARDGAVATVSGNYTAAAASMFVNPAVGDLHLASTATAVVDRVSTVSNALTDWDGHTRPQGAAADYGADELAASTTAAPNQAPAVNAPLSTTVPAPWVTADIGSPAIAGNATYSSGTFTVAGAGVDIWGNADQFRFVYQPLSGDGEIVARVTAIGNTDPWAKAGVMIRESLAAGSRHAFMTLTPQNGVSFQRRLTAAGTSTHTTEPGAVAPYWVRLVRTGAIISAYKSSTGTSWTLTGSETVSMAATVYVGLATTSHNAQALTTATFSNVAVNSSGGAPNAAPTVALTAPGNGASYTAPATISVSATATDSDGTIAQVDFFAGTTPIGSDTTSPYGVTWNGVAAGTYALSAVARDNLGATKTSASVTITVTNPANGLPPPWTTTDIGSPALVGSATFSNGSFTIQGAGTDIWNSADQFRFVYQPLNGDGEIVARVTALGNTDPWAKAGVMIRESLAAGSRHAFVTMTAAQGVSFQRRTVTSNSSEHTTVTSTAVPYWVRLVRAGSTFTGYASNSGNNWTLVGSATISMTANVLVGLAVTSHNASARTTGTFTSTVVSAGPANVSPSVSITSPSSGATFSAPANIPIAASASDPDGTIANVTFYAGSILIGTDISSAYGITWPNVAAGAYTLTAVAVDNRGASSVSGGVLITVGGSVAVPRQLIFTASTNHSTSVTSYRLDIFPAGAPSTAIRTQNVGKPTPVNGDITVDILALVQGLPAGNYFITMTAIGPGGSAQSAPSATFPR